ncbi:hypothetical protein VTK73DRAFT_3519 [Phialemonium thermophilum]|uniref:Uncharacterized protein n=1 Tax=Phialemonium thermophilum TaxID=223376 RepID=A0ABR3VHG4_9PEZI
MRAADGSSAVAHSGGGGRVARPGVRGQDVHFRRRALVGHELRVAEHAAGERGQLFPVLPPRPLRFVLDEGVVATVRKRAAFERAWLRVGTLRLDHHGPLSVAQAGFPRQGGGVAPKLLGLRSRCAPRRGGRPDRRRDGRGWGSLAIVQQRSGRRTESVLHDEDANVARLEFDAGVVVEGARNRRRSGRRPTSQERVGQVVVVLEEGLGVGKQQAPRVEVFLYGFQRRNGMLRGRLGRGRGARSRPRPQVEQFPQHGGTAKAIRTPGLSNEAAGRVAHDDGSHFRHLAASVGEERHSAPMCVSTRWGWSPRAGARGDRATRSRDVAPTLRSGRGQA